MPRRQKLIELDDYVNIEIDGVKFKYIKPHGSVDWFRYNNKPISWSDIRNGYIDDDFEKNLSETIFTLDNADNHHALNELKRYPAISAPLGIYTPIYKKYIDIITQDLKNITSFLFIGFSGLDNDILELIKDIMPNYSKMRIVNGKYDDGNKALTNMVRFLDKYSKIMKGGRKDVLFEGGFTDFIKKEASQWLAS